MIIDKLENLQKYAALNPCIAAVVRFLQQTDLKSLPIGRSDIEGDNLFVNIALAKGKTREEARLETHDQMFDIQIPLSVPESIGYTPRADLPEAAYDAEKDISFYDGLAEQYMTIHPGEFAIYFPQDGHAPCVSVEEQILKAIFKVKNI